MAIPKKKLQSRDDGNQNASYNNDSMDMLMGDDNDSAAPTKAGAPPSPDGDSRDLGSPDLAAGGQPPAGMQPAAPAPSPAAPVTISPAPDGSGGFLVSAAVGTREEAMALAGQLMGGAAGGAQPQPGMDQLPPDEGDQGAGAPMEP